MQATTTRSVEDGAEAAAMLLLVAMGAMVVTTMATTLMEETATAATAVVTAALLQATMAMGVVEAMLLAVSLYYLDLFDVPISGSKDYIHAHAYSAKVLGTKDDEQMLKVCDQ